MGQLAGSTGSDDDRATMGETELQAEEELQITAATAATILGGRDANTGEIFAREQDLLNEMTEIAEAAHAAPDARIRTLLGWVRKNMCPNLGKAGAKWNDLRIIIFTEYDDTKRYIEAAKISPEERKAIFEGNALTVFPRLRKQLQARGYSC